MYDYYYDNAFEDYLLLSILILVGLLSCIFLTLFICINSLGGTIGQHTGIVTAVEYNKNLLWDANLVYFKSSDESTQEDIYCVNDFEIMDELKEYSNKKETVTIYFQNDIILWRWDCNGGISLIEEVSREIY